MFEIVIIYGDGSFCDLVQITSGDLICKLKYIYSYIYKYIKDLKIVNN